MENNNINKVFFTFEEKCMNIINSNYLTSGNNFSELLKFLASNEVFQLSIKKAFRQYSFEEELKKAQGLIIFNVPTDANQIIVLVVGLLFSFDQNKINFSNFLNTNFPQDNMDSSYEIFCTRLIAPFMNNLITSCKITNAENVLRDDGNNKIDMIANVEEKVTPLLEEIRAIVNKDDFLKKSKLDEYLAIIDSMRVAVDINNSVLLKGMWLSFSNTFSKYKPVKSYIASIDKIFVLYSIL